jgi:hypothetical protein
LFEPTPAPGSDAAEPVQLTRRERRAARHGGPAARVGGPAGHRLPPPPVQRRNYQARKGG